MKARSGVRVGVAEADGRGKPSRAASMRHFSSAARALGLERQIVVLESGRAVGVARPVRGGDREQPQPDQPGEAPREDDFHSHDDGSAAAALRLRSVRTAAGIG